MNVEIQPGQTIKSENLPDQINHDITHKKLSERTCVRCGEKIPYKKAYLILEGEKLFGTEPPLISKSLKGIALTKGEYICRECWNTR